MMASARLQANLRALLVNVLCFGVYSAHNEFKRESAEQYILAGQVATQPKAFERVQAIEDAKGQGLPGNNRCFCKASGAIRVHHKRFYKHPKASYSLL